jgi:hypothetical protein
MSDTPSASGSPAGDLQFDRVEYTAPRPTATCKGCGQGLQNVYYEINGQPFCQGCREQIQGTLSGGSSIGRFFRATLYGSLAGLAGAVVYYAVREATNSEFGLISIVVGLMIGKAVKKGSNGRGGWFYQGLAMFLTYTAIVSTYIPPVINAIRDRANEDAVAAKAEQPAKPDAVADAPAAADAGPPPVAAPPLPSLIGQLLVALAFLIGFAYALPILVGFESPMGLIIIAIGLYEAWTINRRAPLLINGPYQIAQTGVGSAVHVEPAG